jgi:hypothetical protein
MSCGAIATKARASRSRRKKPEVPFSYKLVLAAPDGERPLPLDAQAEAWPQRMIEEDFHRLMFETEE